MKALESKIKNQNISLNLSIVNKQKLLTNLKAFGQDILSIANEYHQYKIRIDLVKEDIESIKHQK